MYIDSLSTCLFETPTLQAQSGGRHLFSFTINWTIRPSNAPIKFGRNKAVKTATERLTK